MESKDCSNGSTALLFRKVSFEPVNVCERQETKDTFSWFVLLLYGQTRDVDSFSKSVKSVLPKDRAVEHAYCKVD